MRTVLTASFIRTAVAESGKDRTIFWDSALPGFGLCVTRNGARSFVVQYRANGQSRRLTIDFKLALVDARKEARKRMGEIAKGGDPLAEQRKQAAARKVAASGTLEFVAREYFRREGHAIRTMGDREATLKRLVLPKLGAQQIGDIRRVDLVRLLDQIEDKRGPVMADKTLAYLSRLFNWHAARTDDFRSPIVRGMRRTKPAERARTRVLTDDEIRRIWKAADAKPGPFGALIKFILLTATRRNQAARMAWHEITKNDSEVKIGETLWDKIRADDWTIPARRSKTKADVVLPLSRAASRVLAKIPRIGRGHFVFTYDGERPIKGFAKPKRALDQTAGVTGWTIHDLRRTARTLMSRAGVSADVAERCLGHTIGGIRGTYDRHHYRAEMLRAFEALADTLDHVMFCLPDTGARPWRSSILE
jgi:integrase